MGALIYEPELSTIDWAAAAITEGAGPEPDEVNKPTVTEALNAQGFRIDWHPDLITEQNTATATHVISIGCDHQTIPTSRDIIEWDAPLLHR